MPDNMLQQQGPTDVMDVLNNLSVPGPTGQKPMQEDSDMLSILLSKDEFKNGEMLTEGLKKISSFYQKTLALSNIERDDVFKIVEGAKDLKVAYLMSRPKDDYTWEEEFLWTGFINWLKIEATRGVEGFERLAEVSQIQQNVFENKQNRTGSPSSGGGVLGMLSRFLGSRG